MTKNSLGNNPCQINIDNSGEGRENENKKTTMTVNWENLFGKQKIYYRRQPTLN